MEDDLYALGTVLARVPLSRSSAGAAPGNVQVQRALDVARGPEGVTARASGAVEAGFDARARGASAGIDAGVRGEVEGSIARSDGMVRYVLRGEVSGFLGAEASARGVGASFRAEERGTARFEVAVPESAPPGTDLRSINPFDPATMPVGTRITLDAAQHGSREFGANLRYLATRDRTEHEQGVSVAVEATAPGRVRVSAGPREAIEAYHGLGADLGPASLMAGRTDRYGGGTIRTAEFDLNTAEGREAYARFMSRGALPDRNGPGISEVRRVERLDGSSESQLDIGLGSLEHTFRSGANTASTVRTTDGDGNAVSQTTIRYRERDAQLEIEQRYDADGQRTGRTYAYRLTPNEHEAGLLNAAYGRDPAHGGFRAGEEAVLRFSEADMERLREIAGRANENVQRTGGDDVLRNLVGDGYGAAPRTTTDFAVELIRNPSTLAGVPATLHTLATRSGPETRRSVGETLTPLPGTAESRPSGAQAPAVAADGASQRPQTALPPLSDERNPDHRMYAAIRERAPRGTSEERLAEATLQARAAGIDPDRLGQVAEHGGRLWIDGGIPGLRASVDLGRPSPPLEESQARLQSLAAQESQARTRDQQQDLERQQAARMHA